VIVYFPLIVHIRGVFQDDGVDDFIEGVSARLDLERVGEEDENDYGQLSYGYKEGGGRIHGDDVGADFRSKCEVSENRDDLVSECGGANRRADD
jgi:hypothetical protein